jgi:pyruvate, water dikinase
MMNVGNPDRAFDFAGIPNHGVGLARLEFIINRMIGVHPRALLEFDRSSRASRTRSAGRWPATRPGRFFVDRLAEGIACIAAAFAPEPVIVRLSDFKSNEYANLIGGRQYEPHEENPMLGLPRRRALRGRKLPALLRARVPRAAQGPRGHGPDQRPGDGAVRAHRRGGRRWSNCWRKTAAPRRERPQGHNDVRAADQCAARRPLPGALRRHVDRLQRHDPADARP